ncbi:DUF4242 domain-containing protein [Mesorhizobium retamae]|uniref:DUF4242 domain-containing protein n=1 Tax=Mesorhizobium retamae TaxID=2912854 RepID=A0ABS9QMW5_9HYPH|nr:DUF4242 domain-containing protein [Mesorhizobium sp. IRAMC:0171]MCG7508742.1 DUF4242 domain-containing protein [Mesorhizobium sp. IRAMC:0171]
MNRYLIERDMPGVAGMSDAEFCQAARKSNEVLAEMAARAQWVNSFVTDDCIVCVYLAEDEEAVREHARLSGFPADRVMPVRRMIDPTTANI